MQEAQLLQQMGLSEIKSQVSVPLSEVKSLFLLIIISLLLCTGVIPFEYQRLLGIYSAVSPGARLAAHPHEGEEDTGICNPAGFLALSSPFSIGIWEDQEQKGSA